MSVKDALELAKKHKVEIVDLKFVDFPGLWQHFSIPAAELSAELFEEGLGFDGSSIRGFQSINESDMMLLPDADTAMIDPFSEHPTISFLCNVLDAITREPYTRDPRYVAQKAEKYLKSTGLADTSYWGPEIEFFIFDSVRFDQNHHEGYYHIDSIEGFWNSGNNSVPNLGNKIRYKEGYFPVPPMDQYQDLRSEMVLNLEKCGVKIEVHHHEVATGGLIKHAHALCAFIAPTTNSYRRLVPGYEAPINLVYSARNRSACVRIPMYSTSEKAKRLEFRTPDPSCNPYLAFPAMLMAGLDGIKNKIEPPEPMDKDLYDLPPAEAAKVKEVPGSLEEVLNNLENDHQWLLEGGVFTQDVIDTWIEYKRTMEIDAVPLRPHPYEFHLYYDL